MIWIPKDQMCSEILDTDKTEPFHLYYGNLGSYKGINILHDNVKFIEKLRLDTKIDTEHLELYQLNERIQIPLAPIGVLAHGSAHA